VKYRSVGPRIYIAGPMAGLSDFNFQAFNKMAARLRSQGFTVVNPAELHTHTDQPYEFYLREALKVLLTCDSVMLLHGWTSSKGACLEWRVAVSLKMELLYEDANED
jgi:alkyl hydroperoxide reductase subunit AhpC